MVAATMGEFSFKQEEAFGVVEMVDTSTVVVSVDDEDVLTQVQVNRLIAIQGTRTGEYYIGMVSKIIRKANLDEYQLGLEDERRLGSDIVRVLLVGTFRGKVGTRLNAFTRSVASVPTVGAEAYLVEKARLTLLMGSISSGTADDSANLSIGHYAIDEETPAFIDGNRFFQRHVALVGSTGSGKSWLVAKIIEQVAELESGDAVLFDIHGEYSTLEGEQFNRIRIAGPGDTDPSTALFLPYWLLNHEELTSLMLDRSDQNAPNQAALFSNYVLTGKQEFLRDGTHDGEAGLITLESPVPFDIGKVIDRLNEKDTEMVAGANGRYKQGHYHGKLSRFIQRLKNRVDDKRLNFMFSDVSTLTTYDYASEIARKLMSSNGRNAGVKIVDFSEVPSDILPLVTSLLARLIFTIQQWTGSEARHPIALFCDEAHLYIPAETTEIMGISARSSFQRIAKEGRKYGVGLVVITQRPHEVDKTVLSQCNNFLSMRLTNIDDQNTIRRLFPDNLGDLASTLPILDTGEVVVVGDACLLPSRIIVDAPKHKPTSATVDFWTVWSKQSQEVDYPASIRALRLQTK